MVAECRPAADACGGRGEAAIEELIEQRIAASVGTVFSYLTDPGKFVLWMGREARIDPRPGGAFWLDVDGEHVATGRYELVDPPHRVVLSWGWEGSDAVPPGSTRVEITLDAEGDGTLLRLRHSGLPTRAESETHRKGWLSYLANLSTTASTSQS